MIICKLTLRDWYTKKVQKKTIMPKTPSVAAEIHSRNNPNCLVTLEWEIDGKQNAIQLKPYSMEVDQLQVDEGEMSINRFTTKWYGKISKSKLKQIERELAKEFVEEEEPSEEEITQD
jgi:hypothetical protein